VSRTFTCSVLGIITLVNFLLPEIVLLQSRGLGRVPLSFNKACFSLVNGTGTMYVLFLVLWRSVLERSLTSLFSTSLMVTMYLTTQAKNLSLNPRPTALSTSSTYPTANTPHHPKNLTLHPAAPNTSPHPHPITPQNTLPNENPGETAPTFPKAVLSPSPKSNPRDPSIPTPPSTSWNQTTRACPTPPTRTRKPKPSKT